MKIELEPSSERFDPLDDRWLDQVAQLMTDLRHEVGEVSRCNEPTPGMKGVDLGAIIVNLEPIITSLGPVSAFTAVAGVIKAFIARDRGRSIRAKWQENGHLREIEIRGNNVDDAERLLAALQRTAEPSE